jgi:hypothetical protein
MEGCFAAHARRQQSARKPSNTWTFPDHIQLHARYEGSAATVGAFPVGSVLPANIRSTACNSKINAPGAAAESARHIPCAELGAMPDRGRKRPGEGWPAGEKSAPMKSRPNSFYTRRTCKIFVPKPVRCDTHLGHLDRGAWKQSDALARLTTDERAATTSRS